MHEFDLASLSQKIAGFSAGTYHVRFYAAGVQGYGANPLLVQIDPMVFDDGTVKTDGMIVTFDGMPSITPPEISGEEPFTYFTSDPFRLSAGSHILSFSSAFPQKEDRTSFIEAVSITAVPAIPEPSTYLAGGGLLLLAAMCVRHARAQRQGGSASGLAACGFQQFQETRG